MIDLMGSKKSNDERSAAFDGSCRTGERPKTCRLRALIHPAREPSLPDFLHIMYWRI